MMNDLGRSSREMRQTWRLLLAFASIYIIWGTTYLAIRIAVETLPPFAMAGIRFVLAAVLMFAFCRLRRVAWPQPRQWFNAAVIGFFLMVGGNGLVTWAEQKIPSGIAALVVATMPLWMTDFEWPIFGGSRPRRQTVLGLVLGTLGICLLVGPDQLRPQSNWDLLSMIALIMAPMFWSMGSLITRRLSSGGDVFMATAAQMLCGGILLLLMGLANGEWSSFAPGQVSWRSLTAMLYLAVFGSIIALTAYAWLLKHSSPSRVATYTYVNPIVAVFVGWAGLGETIEPMTFAAMIVIILAVILITTAKRQMPRPKLDTQVEIDSIEAVPAKAPDHSQIRRATTSSDEEPECVVQFKS